MSDKPVAWKVPFPGHTRSEWTLGDPGKWTTDGWKRQGIQLDLAYAAPQAPAPQPLSDEHIEVACAAISKAFQIGQTYWQQADSESYKQNKKAEATRDNYLTLLRDTRAVLAAAAAQEKKP